MLFRSEQLTQAQHKAAEALYKTAGATPEAGSPGGDAGAQGPAGGPDDVIDAEVVDEGKK